MVEVSFCSVRWHYLCRQRDCHSPWAVLWSLARLQSVNQKGILNISAASGCLFSPLVFVLFYFLLSISSDFQTHREVLRSKPAVISFSTDKTRLTGTGLCFWGKEKTVLEYVHEEEGNGELFRNLSLLAKKGMSNLPGLFTQGYRSAAMQAPVQAEVRGLSLLAGFPLLISEISWGILGGLLLFFWSAQWAEQGTRSQCQGNPSWRWLPQLHSV